MLLGMFSIICSMIIALLMTSFLCLLFDCEFDSNLGVAISTTSVILSIPFVPCALKFADKLAVPTLAGFCGF